MGLVHGSFLEGLKLLECVQGVGTEQVSELIADHDAGGIGISTNQGRHDGRIGDTQAVDAAHAQLRIHHGHGVAVGAHLAGAHRVVLRVGAVADILLDAGIVVPVDRVNQTRAEALEVSGFENACLYLCAAQQQVGVFLLVEKLRVDGRGGARVEAGQRDGAAALGAQHFDVATVAVTHVHLAAVIIDDGHHEDELQVRRSEAGGRAAEGAGLGKRTGDHAAAFFLPFEGRARQAQAATERHAEGFFGCLYLVGDDIVDVVLQVTANARQVMERLDAHGLQLRAGADARELEGLRRTEGAGTDDDFAPRSHFTRFAAIEKAHPRCNACPRRSACRSAHW
jgi:hypothetical protein